jgi:RNA polymerase sigma factor (sigma-70 family)
MQEAIQPVTVDQEAFADFVRKSGPRLKQALISSLGGEIGREATAESLAYGWENWDRLKVMDNPVGYLYRVGKSRGTDLHRANRRRRLAFPEPPQTAGDLPWIEPGLPQALGDLTEKQRTTVMLIHAFGWTYHEVADFLGVSRGSVQKHAERGMKRLRSFLKVGNDG